MGAIAIERVEPADKTVEGKPVEERVAGESSVAAEAADAAASEAMAPTTDAVHSSARPADQSTDGRHLRAAMRRPSGTASGFQRAHADKASGKETKPIVNQAGLSTGLQSKVTEIVEPAQIAQAQAPVLSFNMVLLALIVRQFIPAEVIKTATGEAREQLDALGIRP